MVVHVPLLGFGAAHLLVADGAGPGDFDVVQVFSVLCRESQVAMITLKFLDALVNALNVVIEPCATGEALRAERARKHGLAGGVRRENGFPGSLAAAAVRFFGNPVLEKEIKKVFFKYKIIET